MSTGKETFDPRLIALVCHWRGGRQGGTAALDRLIEDGLDVNDFNSEGQNILHWLARNQGILRQTDRVRVARNYDSMDQIARVLRYCGRYCGADPVQSDSYGNLPLHYACGHGDGDDQLLVFNALLPGDEDIDSPNNAGETALHWAQQAKTQGWAELVEVLLKKGANVAAEDKQGRQPLHWAMAKGNGAGARKLVEGGADVNAADRYGRTALYWLCRRAEHCETNYYKGHVLDPTKEAGIVDPDPCYMHAAEGFQYSPFEGFPNANLDAWLMLPVLVKAGADIAKADKAAAGLLAKDKSIAAFYETEGADPKQYLDNLMCVFERFHIRNDEHTTALFEQWLTDQTTNQGAGLRLPKWMAEDDRLVRAAASLAPDKAARWLEVLEDSGADLFASGALCAATQSGADRTVDWLLERHPDLVRSTDGNGQTALHHAAFLGNTLIASPLIAAGADIHARDGNGATVLHDAAPYYDCEDNDAGDFRWSQADADICQVLLAAGANPHAIDDNELPTCLVQDNVFLEPSPFPARLRLSDSQPSDPREPLFNVNSYEFFDHNGNKVPAESLQTGSRTPPKPPDAPAPGEEPGL